MTSCCTNELAATLIEVGTRKIAKKHGITNKDQIEAACCFVALWAKGSDCEQTRNFVMDLIGSCLKADAVTEAIFGNKEEAESQCCGGSCKSDG